MKLNVSGNTISGPFVVYASVYCYTGPFVVYPPYMALIKGPVLSTMVDSSHNAAAMTIEADMRSTGAIIFMLSSQS